MNRLLLLCLGMSVAASACRSDDDDDKNKGADASVMQADAAPGSATTIYDVQSDSTTIGTSVSLRSVVVTAIDGFGGRTGGMYVQDPMGGAFSGVFVFVSASVSDALAVGDIVDVDGGVKDEFAFSEFEDGQSITQVVPADGGAITITKKSSGTVPAAEVLNPWDLAADDDEAEKWEGVLIEFKGVRVLRTASGVSSGDPTLLESSITGPYRMGGSLAQLDEAAERDHCYSSITGIGDYFFNYKILPRMSGDMVTDASGESCLAPESTDVLCGDDIDNDHDGFKDCGDFSCQEMVASCTVAATVVETQNGTIAENTRVRLTDVVVTAVSADNKKFWVQDEGVSAAFNGLYVFRGSMDTDLPVNLVGKKVTLVGNLDEYRTQLTELTNVEEVVVGALSTGVTTLSGIPLADLATMKDYEGVLVSIPTVTIASASSPACSENFSSFSIVNGATPLFANEVIACHTVSADQCYGMLNGIMHYDTFNDRFAILPLANGLGPLNGGNCP